MGTINAYCKICGKGYHMCLSCRDYAKLHPWQKDTDNGEHYKVFQVLKGHTVGLYSDEEARERLNNIDLSDSDSYLDEIKNHINNIMVATNRVENKEDDIRPMRKRRRQSSDINRF